MIKAPFDADAATSYAVRTTNAPPCAAHSPSIRRLAISAAAAPARPDKAGGGGNRAPLLPDGRHDRWHARRPRPAAAASGLLLQEVLSRTYCILIPVPPSSIDLHATANFIRDLLLAGRIRANNIRLAVIANRVRKSMPVYQPLERFLNSLNLPLVARLGDSDVFLSAAESGIGVFD